MALAGEARAVQSAGVTPLLLLTGAIVLLAALAQATTGVGFGVMAGPLVMLVVPGFVPGPLLVVTIVVMALVVWRDRQALDARRLRGPLLASVPGAVVGTWVLGATDERTLRLVVAGAVLVTVGAVATGWRLPAGPRALTVAGLLAGVLSSVAATPGPPMVLTYRAESSAAQRADLSLFFLATSLVSLVVLAVSGELRVDVAGTALLVPFVLGGFALARPLNDRLDLQAVRRAALGLTFASGSVLLVSTLVA